MEQYKLPLCQAKTEFTEKKSRFICHIAPVSSEDEAVAFLDFTRRAHREATHNVYAYRIKKNNICRYSDDGEPAGTAGTPLLEAFVKQVVFDFCCVVTRYFGGVLLGAGGLTRAYARCGAAALEVSGIGVMRETALCAASLPYAQYEVIMRLLRNCGAAVISEDFGIAVDLKFSLPPEKLPLLQRDVAEATAGSVHICVEGNQMEIFRP